MCHFKTINEFKLESLSGNVKLETNGRHFGPCDLEICQMTSKSVRAPLPCSWTLSELPSRNALNRSQIVFEIWWMASKIKWAVTSSSVHYFAAISKFNNPETLKSVQNWRVPSRETLKFDRWHWKTIERLLYATSSFVHHFVTICECKLELRSRNAQIGAKFVLGSVTFTFDIWTWAFAWASLLYMVITPDYCMTVQWK